MNSIMSHSPSLFLMRFPRVRASFIKQLSVSSAALAPVDTSSVDEREIASFSRLATSWWDEDGPMKALHSMNHLRVPWIRDSLETHGPASSSPISHAKPLSGISILDVGCGGGILSEPLSNLGASVLGIDATQECIHVANKRREQLRHRFLEIHRNLRFENVTSEELKSSAAGTFDALVASEILEHVNNRQEFIGSCLSLLKPGGLIFLTTLNSTFLSKFLGIAVAENVLKIVPPGTHDFEKFTNPEDLRFMLEREGCSVRLVHGMCYNPLTNNWSWSSRTDINYAMLAIKH